MYDILRHSHSGLRWVVLALLVAAIFKNFLKWQSKAPFADGDRKLNLFAMTAAHIQLLLGIVLYFVSPKVQFSDVTMKDSMVRFFTVEHNLMMVIAIALITIGYSKSKKATDDVRKFKLAFIYFLIGLLLVLAGIPWPFRENLGGAWF